MRYNNTSLYQYIHVLLIYLLWRL